MDFSCNKLYKPAPGTFGEVLGAWPAEEVRGCDCGFVSWATAAVAEQHAITPQQINAHSGDRNPNAWLDGETLSIPHRLTSRRIGIARDYSIASPTANRFEKQVSRFQSLKVSAALNAGSGLETLNPETYLRSGDLPRTSRQVFQQFADGQTRFQ